MAEIKKHVAKNGTVSYKVKIFLGRVAGKKQFKIKTIRGKRSEAEAWAREQETLRDTGKLPLDERVTLKEWLAKWLKKQKERITQETGESYEAVIKRYVNNDVLGLMPMVKIKPFHVQEFYERLIDLELSARTIQYVHTLLKASFDQAVGMELLDRNPAIHTVRPTKKKPEIVCFDREQAERFLETAKTDKYYVLWLITLTLGLRYEEVAALKISDVDFEKGELKIQRAVGFHQGEYKRNEKGEIEKDDFGKRIRLGGGGFYFKELKTKSSRRTLKLSQSQIAALKDQKRRAMEMKIKNRKHWQENGLLFPSDNGTPMQIENLRNRHFAKILAKAGLPHFTLHSLRHSFATITLVSTGDVKTVSEMLGHSDVAFTMQTYTHVLEEMRERAASKIEEVFFAKKKTAGGQAVDNPTES